MYNPEEDSILLSDSIKKYIEKKGKSFKILDMGTGSGIQAETCKSLGFNNILAADIDTESLKYVKNKVKVKTIKSKVTITVGDCKIRMMEVNIQISDSIFDEILIGRIPFFKHFLIEIDENKKRVILTRTKHE